MLPGDTFVSKLSFSECLNVIECALTDSHTNYAPYAWQVYSSDSRKGRLTAIAKSSIQSDDYPSFSVSFELRLQPDRLTAITWSYDAPVRCSGITELTNAALLNFLNEPDKGKSEGTTTPKVLDKESVGSVIGVVDRAISTASQAGSNSSSNETAKADEGAILGSIPSARPKVISTIPVVRGTTDSAPVSGAIQQSAFPRVNHSGKTGGWLRHFVRGDCCPDCGGDRTLTDNQHCSSDYHQ